MKLRVYLKSFDIDSLMIAVDSLLMVALRLNMEIEKGTVLPTRTRKYCVLRSPHIDKDSREHFEIQIYKSFFDINLNQNSASILEKFLNVEIESGVYCYFKVIY